MGDWWLVPVLGWVAATGAALWALGRENLRLRRELREMTAVADRCGDQADRFVVLHGVAVAKLLRTRAVLRRVWASRRGWQTMRGMVRRRLRRVERFAAYVVRSRWLARYRAGLYRDACADQDYLLRTCQAADADSLAMCDGLARGPGCPGVTVGGWVVEHDLGGES